MSTTPEQAARDMLERMGIENAQNFTAGDVVELANLIAEKWANSPAWEPLTPELLARPTHWDNRRLRPPVGFA